VSSGFPSRFLRTPESQGRVDEILIGLVVAHFVGQGHPLYHIRVDEDHQRLRFRTQDDPVLYAVEVNLRRVTRGFEARAVEDRCPLTITAEIKNFLANPYDLLRMHEQVPSHLPQPAGFKLYRQLNSVFASVQVDHVLGGVHELGSRQRLHDLLDTRVDLLREILQPYFLDAPCSPPKS
jgi:hypothetical protein